MIYTNSICIALVYTVAVGGRVQFFGVPAGSKPTKVFKKGISQDVEEGSIEEEFPNFKPAFRRNPTDAIRVNAIDLSRLALNEDQTLDSSLKELTPLVHEAEPSLNDDPVLTKPSRSELFRNAKARGVPLLKDRRPLLRQNLGHAKEQINLPPQRNELKFQPEQPSRSFVDEVLPAAGSSVVEDDSPASLDINFTPVCPDAEFNYIIPHPVQCDAFFLCDRGVVHARLCPDGMVFFVAEAKCLLPKSLEGVCEGRPRLQPPSGTGPCIRQNGVFHVGDTCRDFVTCKHNIATRGACAEGLVFDTQSKICGWADEVLRPGCLPSDLLGFTCPNPILTQEEALKAGVHLPFGDHNRHADVTDCRYYFICLVTGHPRRAGCGNGNAFNPANGICMAPEEVPGCEHLAVK